jgi:putative DNA-invertase from lambdoid prophage Rac
MVRWVVNDVSKKPLTVALYARVSTTDQRCAIQLAELNRYADARGWTVCNEYVDKGFSGKTKERPALKRCLADAKAHRFDAILVWKLDRWGRTVAQLSQDILDFDSMGIRFIAVEQGIDSDKANAMSRFMVHIMSAFAELEREMIHERVLAGVRYAQKHGTKSGNPIGRPRVAHDRPEVWAMKEKGNSVRQIATALGLSHGTVQRIVAAKPE